MKNLFLFHLVSGHAWFTCGLLFLLVAILDVCGVFDQRKRLRGSARILLIVVSLVAPLTGTPVSLWLAIPLTLFCLAYLGFAFANKNRTYRRISAAFAGTLVLGGLLLELPYHLTRTPEGPRPQRLYVIADSLAAGLGRERT